MQLKPFIGAGFAALLLLGAAGCDREPAATEPTADSAVVRDYTLPDLDGNPHSLNQWAGEVVLINFWAPWCPPCRREMPALAELYDNYRDQGLVVVGVAIDTPFNTRNFVEEEDIRFPILVAEEQGIEISRDFGNRVGALPYTVVIDREGRQTYSHRSEITYEEAEAAIKPHL